MKKRIKEQPKERFLATKSFFKNRQVQSVSGVFTLLFGVFLLISFFSFFFTWQEDQSNKGQFFERKVASENLLGKVGESISRFFIEDGFR